MLSAKQKLGAGLSFALTLCLAATGVASMVPATNALAEETHVEILYDPAVGVEPSVTVFDDMGNIIPSSEYNVAYENNKAVGTGTVVITDATGGNYTVNTMRKTFEIQSAGPSASESALDSIKNIIEGTGTDVSTLPGSTEEEQIINGVKAIAEANQRLTQDLASQQNRKNSYGEAIAQIYNKLTGQNITIDDTTDISSVLNTIIGKINALQEELASTKSELASTKSALQTAQNNNAALQQRLNEEIAEKEATITGLESQIEIKNRQIEELQNAETSVAELQSQIEELQATITDLRSQIAEKNEQIANLQNAQATATELQTQLTAKDKEIEELEASLKEYKKNAEGFLVTVDVANEMFGFNLAAGSDSAAIESAIREYIAMKVANDKTIAGIQAITGSTNTGDALVADVATKISTGNTSTPESNELSYKNGYNAGYVAGIDAWLGELSYENGYGEGYAAGGKNGMTVDVSSLTNQIESLNKQVKTLSDENTSLKSDVSGLQAENEDLSVQVAAFSASNDTLREQVNTANASNGELQGRINDLNASNGDLQNRVNALNASNEELKGRINSSGVTNEDLSDQINDLKSRNNSLSGQVASLTNQIATLKENGNATRITTGNTQQNNEPAGDEQKQGKTSEEVVKPIEPTSTQEPITTQQQIIPTNTTTTLNNGEIIKLSELTNKTDTTQKAKTVYNVIENGDISGITTNAKSLKATTTEQKETARKILDHYMSNLSKVGQMGYPALSTAAKDEKKSATFTEFISVDVTPSEEQVNAVAKGEKAYLTLTSKDIEDGKYYLAIHGSDKRTGSYDVLLVKAKGNTIAMNLPDLSPVTIASIIIGDAIGAGAETSAQTMEQPTTATDGINMQNLLILLLIAGGVAAAFIVVMVLIKKKSFGGPKKASKKEDYDEDGYEDDVEMEEDMEDFGEEAEA